MIVIKQHQSLAELYASLCMKSREIAVEDSSGNSVCMWCSRKKSSHLPDQRCSCSALSRQFKSLRFDETAAVEKALRLLEELMQL